MVYVILAGIVILLGVVLYFSLKPFTDALEDLAEEQRKAREAKNHGE